jgi:uncharacterized protein with HEPN domain
MPPELRSILFDMKHAANGVELFVSGKTLSDYRQDLMLRSAVERQFEIIGEALNRLRKAAPDLAARISEHDRIINFHNVPS